MSYAEQLHAEFAKLQEQKIVDANQLRHGESLYRRYKEYVEKNQKIEWSTVIPAREEVYQAYEKLAQPSADQIQAALKKVAVLKLNGGLGTSMGCDGPKSLIAVRDNLSFLDFTLAQIEHINVKYGADVPFVVMNSFNTTTQTMEHLAKQKARFPHVRCVDFNQFELPRMEKNSMLPVDLEGAARFYPPGHGYVYECLRDTGAAKKLVDMGIQWLFISNSDNLGAVLDERIAHFVTSQQQYEFVSEQTLKTLADVKGGVLYHSPDGAIRLLETAQVPPEHMDDFCDIKMFKYFNINNLWINLPALLKTGEI